MTIVLFERSKSVLTDELSAEQRYFHGRERLTLTVFRFSIVQGPVMTRRLSLLLDRRLATFSEPDNRYSLLPSSIWMSACRTSSGRRKPPLNQARELGDRAVDVESK